MMPVLSLSPHPSTLEDVSIIIDQLDLLLPPSVLLDKTTTLRIRQKHKVFRVLIVVQRPFRLDTVPDAMFSPPGVRIMVDEKAHPRPTDEVGQLVVALMLILERKRVNRQVVTYAFGVVEDKGRFVEMGGPDLAGGDGVEAVAVGWHAEFGEGFAGLTARRYEDGVACKGGCAEIGWVHSCYAGVIGVNGWAGTRAVDMVWADARWVKLEELVSELLWKTELVWTTGEDLWVWKKTSQCRSRTQDHGKQGSKQKHRMKLTNEVAVEVLRLVLERRDKPMTLVRGRVR